MYWPISAKSQTIGTTDYLANSQDKEWYFFMVVVMVTAYKTFRIKITLVEGCGYNYCYTLQYVIAVVMVVR